MAQILLIEDDPMIRDSIEDMLDLEGFQLTTAVNGLAGLDAVHRHPPDLVICDVNMPEVDGFGVLSALRSDPSTSNLPFIFLTARVGRNDMRQGMDLGADDYLMKPFTANELVHAIRSRLERMDLTQASYREEKRRSQELQNQVKSKSDQVELKARLLDKLLQDLRMPLANINMALSMLERSTTEAERQRYLCVLRQEYTREVALVNEVSNLQELTNAGGLNGFTGLHSGR